MRSSRRRNATCFYCGGEYPAGAVTCPNCGRSFWQSPTAPAADGGPAQDAVDSSAETRPAYVSSTRSDAHARSNGSAFAATLESTPVLVGLAMVALVLVLVAAALLFTRGGGAGATASPAVVAVATVVPSPSAGPTATATAVPTPSPTDTPSVTPATPTRSPTLFHGSTAAPKRPGFSVTGSMEIARAMQTATLLENGKVLVTGGGNATAELYDPTTGRFLPTGSMSEARSGQTATLLLTGRVLIVGGTNDATAELYDPAKGSFSLTGSMAAARSTFTATLLKSGKVLIVGGADASGAAELYDPSTGRFTPAGALVTNRRGHTATLLPDGRVLITGGIDSSSRPLASAELYDPTTGRFSSAGFLNDARTAHVAVLLKNGHVLIAGGSGTCGASLPGGAACAGGSLTSVETYDPKTHSFSRAGAMLTAQGGSSGLSAATQLADGTVLFTGGAGDSGAVLRAAELYDPGTGRFTSVGALLSPRANHSMTLLRNGSVLIDGGVDGTSALSSAEVYKP